LISKNQPPTLFLCAFAGHFQGLESSEFCYIFSENIKIFCNIDKFYEQKFFVRTKIFGIRLEYERSGWNGIKC